MIREELPLRDMVKTAYGRTARDLTEPVFPSPDTEPLSAANYLADVRRHYTAFRAFIQEGGHDVALARLPTGWPATPNPLFPETGLRVLDHTWANVQGLELRPDMLEFRDNSRQIAQVAKFAEPASIVPPAVQDAFDQFGQAMQLFQTQMAADGKPASVCDRCSAFTVVMVDLAARFAAGHPDLQSLPDALRQAERPPVQKSVQQVKGYVLNLN